ncbi:MAG: hypothetical protein AAF717_02000 [Bacteroidota bacterium]
MNRIKQIRFHYLVVLAALGITCYYFVENKKLEQRLDQIVQDNVAMEQQRTQQERLLQIDSMVVAGENYQEALMAYNDQLEQPIEDDFMGIELRVALTKKLQRLHRTNVLSAIAASETPINDSLELAALAAGAKEHTLQQLDSMGFVLEKTKVKLERAQRQLQQNGSGEYLTFTTSKGSKLHYIGQVKNGKANGFGVAILSTGSRYEGQWKDNHRHGQGKFYWTDGHYYIGAYSDDKRNGEGTYFWPNGEKFVGLWSDDERTGEGVFYGKKGDVIASGLWEEDELVVINKSSDK